MMGDEGRSMGSGDECSGGGPDGAHHRTGQDRTGQSRTELVEEIEEGIDLDSETEHTTCALICAV
jgi:hypothetical protein